MPLKEFLALLIQILKNHMAFEALQMNQTGIKVCIQQLKGHGVEPTKITATENGVIKD